jgi:hypothetical protein
MRRTHLSEVPPPVSSLKAYSRVRATLKPNRIFSSPFHLSNFKTELERIGFLGVDARQEDNEVITELTLATAFDSKESVAEWILAAIKVIGYLDDDFNCQIALIKQADAPN